MAYNMKDQLAVGKLGEQVAIDYVKKSCELGRLSFESYEDVRSIKTYQEQDIDFLIHRKDGRTVTLDANYIQRVTLYKKDGKVTKKEVAEYDPIAKEWRNI